MGLTVDDIGVHTLSFILYGLSGDSVRQGTSSDIFSCFLVAQKEPNNKH